MSMSNARLLVCCAFVMNFVQVASAADILIADAKSLTMAPGGVLIVGSASSPFVYKVRPGSSTVEKFIDRQHGRPRNVFLWYVGGRLHKHLMDN